MLNFSDAKVWEQALSQDPKLKKLAIKANVVNNPKRAEELHHAFAWNCGDDVCKNEAEKELCRYLFGFGEVSCKNAVAGRTIAAHEAKETEL